MLLFGFVLFGKLQRLFVLCFVLSLFRFHASPETTGEGKRGIGPARAGVTLEGTGETVPRGDGEPTRGGV